VQWLLFSGASSSTVPGASRTERAAIPLLPWSQFGSFDAYQSPYASFYDALFQRTCASAFMENVSSDYNSDLQSKPDFKFELFPLHSPRGACITRRNEDLNIDMIS